MKKLFFLLLFISMGAYSQNHYIKTNRFNIDITINNSLTLLNGNSILKTLGDQTGKLIDDEKLSRIQLKNRNSNQYIILYHLNGSNGNTFNKFEIGVLSSNKKDFKPTSFKRFVSETGIRLGIPMEKLIDVKGNKFKESFENGTKILKYEISDDDFIKRYNMPTYTAEYYFIGGKLKKFIFGFPNL